jgi:hypothetical protein
MKLRPFPAASRPSRNQTRDSHNLLIDRAIFSITHKSNFESRTPSSCPLSLPFQRKIVPVQRKAGIGHQLSVISRRRRGVSLPDWETVFNRQWSVVGKRKRADPPFANCAKGRPPRKGHGTKERATREEKSGKSRSCRLKSPEKGIGGRIVLGVVCAGVLRFSG